MLPATERLEEFGLGLLVEQQAYFVLHAPRQTGKTTAMAEWARQLTATGKHICVCVCVEVGAAFPDDVGSAENAILYHWEQSIAFQLPAGLRPSPRRTDTPPGSRIYGFLTAWSAQAPLPVFSPAPAVTAVSRCAARRDRTEVEGLAAAPVGAVITTAGRKRFSR